jgi:hypothetical protein
VSVLIKKPQYRGEQASTWSVVPQEKIGLYFMHRQYARLKIGQASVTQFQITNCSCLFFPNLIFESQIDNLKKDFIFMLDVIHFPLLYFLNLSV